MLLLPPEGPRRQGDRHGGPDQQRDRVPDGEGRALLQHAAQSGGQRAGRQQLQDGPRAGPTLAGIFGRRIATLPDYNFSPALRKLDIVWTPETVSKLFEIGPAAYTPGTKMPEQKIGSAEDRAALVEFLKKATK